MLPVLLRASPHPVLPLWLGHMGPCDSCLVHTLSWHVSHCSVMSPPAWGLLEGRGWVSAQGEDLTRAQPELVLGTGAVQRPVPLRGLPGPGLSGAPYPTGQALAP